MKPLKFDELHAGMMVWDNFKKIYLIIDAISLTFFPTEVEKRCNEGRFYLSEVKDDFTDMEWKELCEEYGIHIINHKISKPKTREKAIELLEAMKKCFEEEYGE